MVDSVDERVRARCERARRAARRLQPTSSGVRVAVLGSLARLLRHEVGAILQANAVDMARAEARGLSAAMLDRLHLTPTRVEQLASAVEEIAELPDPVGETVSDITRPNGLRVRRIRVPLGVIAMVYEARPNVTIDAAALGLRTGNAMVLRGGSEAQASNEALHALVQRALREHDLPEDAVTLLGTERDEIRAVLQQTEFVDLAIPRGGEALIRFVTEHARVPVVQHYKGVCHLLVDASAELEQVSAIVHNAKLSRPGVCNALECLLVAREIADALLPPLVASLVAAGCEVRGCRDTVRICHEAKAATDADFGAEFLAKVLAVRVVDSLDQALEHIARYGSGHTEAILTRDLAHAARFRLEVDAACVVVNASTRFHDGGELGLGAELGIATSRLHWRGPMGLEALTTMKWLVDGAGQTR